MEQNDAMIKQQDVFDAICHVEEKFKNCTHKIVFDVLQHIRKEAIKSRNSMMSRWVIVTDKEGCIVSAYCGRCNYESDFSWWMLRPNRVRYCPNCGAKMETVKYISEYEFYEYNHCGKSFRKAHKAAKKLPKDVEDYEYREEKEKVKMCHKTGKELT